MARKKKVKILFIGNSHTYYHDLPAWVALQEHSHPFDDVPGYIEAATTLASWIREDGAHASERGIEFAAKIIWSTIETDFSHGK